MEHNNEQRSMTDFDGLVEQSHDLKTVHAPASLIPSVLSRLRNTSLLLDSQIDQVDQLMAALEDSNWHVRASAVRMLGELGKRTPVESLINALNDEDETVRAAAVQALGKLGERAPVDQLIATLHDSSWTVREVAALTLGALGNRVSIQPLIDILNAEDEDTFVREAAQIALQLTSSEDFSSPTSESNMTPQLEKHYSSETGKPAPEQTASVLAKLMSLPKSLLGRNAMDSDRQGEDKAVEAPTWDTAGPNNRQPVLAKPKRHLALNIVEGTLAALLVLGLVTSWLILTQKLRPSSLSHSSHAGLPPTATPITLPSWTGHNVNVTIDGGVVYIGAIGKAIYALRTSDGSLLWRYNTDGPIGSSPLVVNGIVYVSISIDNGLGHPTGYVSALRASDGALLWRFTSTSDISIPTVVDGIVYVGAQDGIVSALQANDGSLLWRYTTKGAADNSPLVANGIVYVSSSIDKGAAYLYALRASDGSLLWRYSTPKGYVDTPTVVNGVAYTDSEEGIVALRESDGTRLWRYNLADTGFTQPVVLNGVVYTSAQKISLDTIQGGGYLARTSETVPHEKKIPFKSGVSSASVYALRATNGTALWHYMMFNNNKGDDWGYLLSVVDGVVYIDTGTSTNQDYITALRASDGLRLWRYATEDFPSAVLAVNGVVYIGSDGTMYALRASNGSVLWRTAINGIVLNTPILSGGLVYLGTTSGYVYALQANNGSPRWQYLTDPTS